MQKIISGLQPTSALTLGNYLGVIQKLVALQKKYVLYVFIADLHALTTNIINPKQLRQNRWILTAFLAACGLDFSQNYIFYQSSINAHSLLSYLLVCHTYLGELNRMIQFKEKKQQHQQANKTLNIPSGLLFYPCLMAADVLLYDVDYILVGVDQQQHWELTSTLAQRCNKKYQSQLFQIPAIFPWDDYAKIYDLANPKIKMSKSNPSTKGVIFLNDDPQKAKKKILQAQTDSYNQIKYDYLNQPGISNLLTIYSGLSNQSITTLCQKYQNSNYAVFKNDLATLLATFLENLQKRYSYFIANIATLEAQMQQNAQKANQIAQTKIALVQNVFGLSTVIA